MLDIEEMTVEEFEVIILNLLLRKDIPRNKLKKIFEDAKTVLEKDDICIEILNNAIAEIRKQKITKLLQ